jgi:hypothetical protein
MSSSDVIHEIKARIDALVKSHVEQLISADAPRHDAIAGGIRALQSLRKDIDKVARKALIHDDVEPGDEA